MGWCHFEVAHGTQNLRMVVTIGIIGIIIELAMIIILITGITGSIKLVDWRMASWM